MPGFGSQLDARASMHQGRGPRARREFSWTHVAMPLIDSFDSLALWPLEPAVNSHSRHARHAPWRTLCQWLFALVLACCAPAIAAEPLAVPLDLDSVNGHDFKMRWPESRLAPENANGMIHVVDAVGAAQAAAFVLAPGDVGRASHPLWLLIRVQGTPPYTMYVDAENGTAAGPSADTALTGLANRLSTLPDATVRSQYWGPLTSALATAESSQQRRGTRFSTLAVASAVILGLLLIAAVGAFARRQSRRDDVSRL